jgi:ATP/maltotriose-dependent transcriptional regulator MalT
MASSLAQEALQLFQEVGDRGGAGLALLLQAYVAIEQGEYVKAHSLLEECLAVFRELGDKRRMAVVLVHLARVLFAQGDTLNARALVEEGLAGSKALGDKENSTLGLFLSGQIALQQGDAATAHSLFAECLTLSRRYRGAQVRPAEVLSLLARAVTVQGDYAAARALFEESLALCAQGCEKTIPSCLEGLAGLVAVQGELAWAAQLWGAAEALRETIGAPIPAVSRPSYERAVTAARSQLGEKLFIVAWGQGRTMTLEHVLVAQGPMTMPASILTGPSTTPPGAKVLTSPEGLTEREVEVLRLVAQGLTDAQVADQLVISPRTVNGHLRSIYSKIGVTSRSAATRYAVDHHLA